MRLTNYEFAETVDKKVWLNSLEMNIGLPYFGGKSRIGKYILNNVFNLSVIIKEKRKNPDIFIDAFTGGGKIGLSIPKGWYDTIVINDLDFGVYSYYKYCQDDYISLMYMIKEIGDNFIDRESFYISAYLRNYGKEIEFKDKNGINPLVSAALTFWVASAAFNNQTDPDKTAYNLTRYIGEDDNKKEDKALERENIEKIINRAFKNIPKLHEKLNCQHYIIENLDYRELIKKYNGFDYMDIINEEQREAEPAYSNKTKLWYFDPPYHPVTLYGGMEAPYANTFTIDLAEEMIKILHGDKEAEYGKLDYFIKSDYDPNNISEEDIPEDKEKERKITELRQAKESFKSLEKYPFCKILVGGFNKGAIEINENGEKIKNVGMEYVWCKGFPEGYENIEGEPAK